jgi:hypothetical protein
MKMKELETTPNLKVTDVADVEAGATFYKNNEVIGKAKFKL